MKRLLIGIRIYPIDRTGGLSLETRALRCRSGVFEMAFSLLILCVIASSTVAEPSAEAATLQVRGWDGRAGGLAEGPEPRSLEQLCLFSDVIVVGTVTKVVREAHTPYNAQGPSQHTVFIVNVESTLKDRQRNVGKAVKVRQNQGSLPWSKNGSSGVGFRYHEEPMLQVGRRYVLFLKSNYRSPSQKEKGYAEATVDGVRGRSGELDELALACGGVLSQILLKDGKTWVPQEPGRGAFTADSFKRGEPSTLFGLPEASAIRAIQDCLRNLPQ